jgi:hypothetical protein
LLRPELRQPAVQEVPLALRQRVLPEQLQVLPEQAPLQVPALLSERRRVQSSAY